MTFNQAYLVDYGPIFYFFFPLFVMKYRTHNLWNFNSCKDCKDSINNGTLSYDCANQMVKFCNNYARDLDICGRRKAGK
jgi:hypothetical protein